MFVSITLLNAQVAVQMFILTKTTKIIKLWVYNKTIRTKVLTLCVQSVVIMFNCKVTFTRYVHRKKFGLLINYFK